LVSGAAGVAKVINDNKAAQHQLEELKRYIMESHGVYLATSMDEKSQRKK